MKRQVTAVMVIVFLLGLARFAVFAIERRPQRGSNTLRREVLALEPFTAKYVPIEPSFDGSTAELMDCDRHPDLDAAALLKATHASTGGAPPGLAAATTGCAFRYVKFDSLRGQLEPLLKDADVTRCLEALSLGAVISSGTGTHGFKTASDITELALRPCATALARIPEESRASTEKALTAIHQRAPSLQQAFREEDLDQQLRVFGSFMRAADRDELPSGAKALALAAPLSHQGFVDDQRLISAWLKMTKASHEAIDALTLPTIQSAVKFAQLEASLTTPITTAAGLHFEFSEWDSLHFQRLDMLEQLTLALRLTDPKAAEWPALSEREAGDFSLTVLDATHAELTSKLTKLLVPLERHTKIPVE